MSTHTDDPTPDASVEDDQPGLSWRRDPAIDAVATISLGEDTRGEAVAAITTSDHLQEMLVDDVRELLAGVPYYERQRTLEAAGVTAADGMYATVLTALDRPAERVDRQTFTERYPDTSPPEYDALHRHAAALDVTEQFGQAEPSIIGHLSADEVFEGPLAVFDATDRSPTVTVTADYDAFESDGRDDQERLLEFVVQLAEVCEVRLVCKPVTARWLAREFREIIPTEFRETVRARCGGSPTTDIVDAARDELKPDSRQVDLLRELAAEPDDVLSLHALQSIYEISDGRLSQILGQLERLGLAERYGKRTDRRVQLLQPGAALLDALDEDVGQQSTLDSEFSSETGASTECQPDMCNHALGTRPPDASDDADSRGGDTGWLTSPMNRRRHAPAVEAAQGGGLALIDAPVDDLEDKSRLWSYNEDRDELVVGVRVTSRLSYLVSTALSLSDPRTWDRVLPSSTVDADHPFSGFATTDRDLLRGGRQLGYLSDDLEDSAEWREKILEWREDLGEWTRDLRTGDGGEELGSRIFRNAKGLIGVMTHALDLAGVDVTVLGIVPDVKRDFGAQAEDGEKSQREKLAETIVGQASIDAAYGHYTVERTVFEQREEKVRTAGSPRYDADDPLADLVADTVLVGPGVSILKPLVQDAVDERDPREDAPEVAISFPIRTECRREVYRNVVHRLCAQKNLRPRRAVTTLLHSLTASPFDAAAALDYLQPEDTEREICLDEARYALAQLSTDRLLPDLPRSVGKITAALLTAEEPLSKTALAEAADVSRRTVSRHIGKLTGLGLVVTDEDDAYRLALPFRDERHRDLLPEAVDDETLTKPQDILFEVVLEEVSVDEAGRLGDPDDPLGRPFFGARMDADPLLDERPDLRPWVNLSRRLCDAAEAEETAVTYGVELSQTSIRAQAAASGGAST